MLEGIDEQPRSFLSELVIERFSVSALLRPLTARACKACVVHVVAKEGNAPIADPVNAAKVEI